MEEILSNFLESQISYNNLITDWIVNSTSMLEIIYNDVYQLKLIITLFGIYIIGLIVFNLYLWKKLRRLEKKLKTERFSNE